MAAIEYVSKEVLTAKLQTLLSTLKTFIHTKTEIMASLAGKVDKVEGKGLSTNDYTAEDKAQVSKISGLVANGGEPNTIDVIKVNNVAVTPDSSKVVSLTIPTFTLGQTIDAESGMQVPNSIIISKPDSISGTHSFSINISNPDYANVTLSGDEEKAVRLATTAFVTNSITTATSNFITSSDVDAKINNAFKAKVTIVNQLPATGEEGILYLVPMTGATNKNKYEEYRWVIDGGTVGFELMGPRELDLTGYIKETDLTEATITDEEINALFAGWE